MTTKEVLTAFSPGHEFLAIATADGRVKNWDAGSGHLRGEFVEITASTSGEGLPLEETNGHLAVNYSCMTWAVLPSQSRKGKKKGAKDKGLHLLVLGTEGGDVLAWDATLGQLKWRATDCNSGGVKSVAVAPTGQILYTAGADGMICELNCASGDILGKFKGASKRAVSCIAVAPDGGTLLVASSQLKLFDLASKKSIRKFPGHPGTVKALAFSQDGKYFLSAAMEERQVIVWQVEGSGNSEEAWPLSLTMDHPPVQVQCNFPKQGEGPSKVVAISSTGAAYIWQIAAGVGLKDLEKTKPMKVSVAKSKTGGKARVSAQVLAACLERARKDSAEQSALIAHGTTAKPSFEHVKIQDPGTELVLESGGGLLSSAAQLSDPAGESGKAAPGNVTVLGPDSAADADLSRACFEVEGATPASTSPMKSKKKRQAASADLDAEAPLAEEPARSVGKETGDGDAPTAMDEDNDEQTMEERLIALGILDRVPDDNQEVGSGGTAGAATKKALPRGGSVQVLLSQALQAEDSALLEQCLGVADEKVIGNTVRMLRPADAAKLLNVCIVKLETRPRRGLALVPWIRSVLLQHASSLMSNPGVQPVLSTLHHLVEARLSVFQPLLALSGRLDLIMAQISANEAQQDALDDTEAVVYEEVDSEPDAEEIAEEDEDDEEEEEEEGGDSLEDGSDMEGDSEDEEGGKGEGADVKSQRGKANGHHLDDDDDDDLSS